MMEKIMDEPEVVEIFLDRAKIVESSEQSQDNERHLDGAI